MLFCACWRVRYFADGPTFATVGHAGKASAQEVPDATPAALSDDLPGCYPFAQINSSMLPPLSHSRLFPHPILPLPLYCLKQ
jgi:hypothetical protein